MKVDGIGEKRVVSCLIAMFLAMAIALPEAGAVQLARLDICGKRS